MPESSKLRRIVLLRHGDTVGESATRFHGSGDVELSLEGRQQVRDARRTLRTETFDLVVASPLRRSWQSARIVAGGAPIRLEGDFREIHFGRWEGLTAEEIEARDPILYADWQARAPAFEFPAGEPREAFRQRVLAGLARIEASGFANVLAVLHKGVIRAIAEGLLGEPLESGIPELAQVVALSRAAGGAWFVGRRGSNPAGLDDAA